MMKLVIIFFLYVINLFNYFINFNEINFETLRFMKQTKELDDYMVVELDINDPKKRKLIIKKYIKNTFLHDKIILKKIVNDNRLRFYIHHGYYDGLKTIFLLDDILKLPNPIRNKELSKTPFIPGISDIIGIFYVIYLYSLKKLINFRPLKEAFIISKQYNMLEYNNKKQFYNNKYSLSNLILADIAYKIVKNTKINNFLIIVSNDLTCKNVNNLIPIIFHMDYDNYDNFIYKFMKKIKLNYFLINQSRNIIQLRQFITYYLDNDETYNSQKNVVFDVVITLIPLTNISVPYLNNIKVINKRPRSMLYINIITDKNNVYVSYNSIFNEFKNFNL
jgi:hypothetical protein